MLEHPEGSLTPEQQFENGVTEELLVQPRMSAVIAETLPCTLPNFVSSVSAA